MQFKIDFDIKGLTIPYGFVEKHMVSSPPAYVVVYIFLLDLAFSNRNMSYKDIASNIDGVLEGDVVGSIQYWKEKKVIDITLDGAEEVITFLPIENQGQTVINKDVEIFTKPTYSMADLERLKGSHKDITRIFNASTDAFGTLINGACLNEIYYIYDCLRFSAELIEYLLAYCKENCKGVFSIAFVSGTADKWYENNVKDVESAKNYINRHNSESWLIRKELGMGFGELTSRQEAYVKKWKEDYGFSIEVILEACVSASKKTYTQNFEYLDKILSNWHEGGVVTLQDAIKYCEDHFTSEPTATKKTQSRAPKKTKNKFANFTQKSLDFEKLEKLAKQKMLNDAKDD